MKYPNETNLNFIVLNELTTDITNGIRYSVDLIKSEEEFLTKYHLLVDVIGKVLGLKKSTPVYAGLYSDYVKMWELNNTNDLQENTLTKWAKSSLEDDQPSKL